MTTGSKSWLVDPSLSAPTELLPLCLEWQQEDQLTLKVVPSFGVQDMCPRLSFHIPGLERIVFF